jgi:membrane-bound lytic murein transglycosylase D
MLMSVACGLSAQDNSSQVINRPLRSQPSAPDSQSSSSSSPLPTPHSLFPIFSLYPLLTPEALNQPLTKHYIERYSNSAGIAWINSIIRNSSLYLPFVKNEIAKRGLPPELAYLPFIESGYLGTARSKSGAAGLWQFMMNSIAPFNMKVNDLIDERRDFRKSTIAALQKLEDNYRALGNWPMSLAAYNAGLGAVSRAARRVNTSDYWTLCARNEFNTETIHYVPKFLAVSYILSRPRQFGLDYWPETMEWTVIRPGRQASLDLIATEAGVDRNVLRRLNPELLLNITPADRGYELKIPLSHAESISAVLEREGLRLIQYYQHQIQYGDTLSALARHYGVSLNMIGQHNPGILNRYLRIGETVIIPILGDMPAASLPRPVPGPSQGAYLGIHTIIKGDTLWSLAIRYRVDPLELARENNMELNSILSIGKTLKVPIIE